MLHNMLLVGQANSAKYETDTTVFLWQFFGDFDQKDRKVFPQMTH